MKSATRLTTATSTPEAVAHRLLEVDRVDAVTVRVRKPHVKLGGPLAYAAVEVVRRRAT